ncbi:hypothetical protein TRFO_22347 [Tritrichomonas foetus]|uniref:Uncharacterized protein n=1 Tax=Tritrichomonas foetus TaxID=1144522 RepID=A0A1J4KCJ0_9EUKA|nr:hypothetical protein TRFO_22347 [Tritrichomonas foetus]|eukprot:OHT08931.1 hypothetical protein TRFO_22347 [Tritrichomonas foetus]
MDFRHEISLLRIEKQKAVKALDFAKAQKIEENINILKENSKSYSKTTKRANDANTFETDRLEISGEAVRIASEHTQEIYGIRIQYQKMLITLHDSQMKEMTELTNSLSKDLELCSTRAMPQVQMLEKDAQFQANRSNFVMANCLLEEAKKVRTQIIEDRQNSIHHTYCIKQDKMIAKHEQTNANFQAKMNADINDVYARFRKQMRILRQRYISAASKYGVTVPENEVDEFFAPFKIQDELGQAENEENSKVQPSTRISNTTKTTLTFNFSNSNSTNTFADSANNSKDNLTFSLTNNSSNSPRKKSALKPVKKMGTASNLNSNLNKSSKMNENKNINNKTGKNLNKSATKKKTNSSLKNTALKQSSSKSSISKGALADQSSSSQTPSLTINEKKTTFVTPSRK